MLRDHGDTLTTLAHGTATRIEVLQWTHDGPSRTALNRLHGRATATYIQRRQEDVFRVTNRSLYPSMA
jgi:hypothetical protein